MNWTQPIDIYCERTDPSFWAEPLNALSNAFFIIAAAYAFSLWRRQEERDGPALLLIALVAVIGVGSFLFHTFANRWSALADVIPISIFIYVYLGLALRRFFRFGWAMTGISIFLFAVFSFGAEGLFRPLVGGSAGYVPALLIMAGVGVFLYFLEHPAAGYLFAAAAVFTLSLALRTADMPVCEALPIGTHYFWHALNAVTLTILILAAMRCRHAKSALNHLNNG
ncbi:ceramidase domain-containing protein [Afifella pfennigii]|uniref:ceramidase domain-containing protein n=1 Tax=Afifella pfennigii TaxID=209897 RepID=UPI00047931F3|nr:ceramidase domain-containing protein [Afifella pfennigii]